MWFSRLAVALLLCVPAFGGYARRSTVTFAGSTSGTLTNFTDSSVTVAMNDLRTVANGGVIQNATCTNVTTNVPCDFILTDDGTCATLTGGYKWVIETYDPTLGTIRFHSLLTSLTTSSKIPFVCFGNLAVSTYQGGTAGTAYDSNTVRVHHFPNGTVLSGVDFGPSQVSCTLTNTPAAGTGQIDGGMAVTGTQYCTTTVTTPIATAFTLTAWVKITTTSGDKAFFGNNSAGGSGGLELRINGGTPTISILKSQQAALWTSAGSVTNGTFAYISVTSDALGNYILYRDGAVAESFPVALPFIVASPIWAGGNSFGEMFVGTIDYWRIDNTQRSAAWVATARANQLSPPAMSAPVTLGNCTRMLLGVGC